MKFQYHDGGRANAGYKGVTGDCVVRAISIATGLDYQHVYDLINIVASNERPTRRGTRSNSRTGVFRKTADKLLRGLGWTWHPVMGIGTGCTMHLKDGEIPMGRIIVSLSKHWAAVVDGVLYDLSDCSREGTRCVYGYWSKP
jgi:hypothetical protein